MARQNLKLELEQESFKLFERIQNALGHEEPEETLSILLRLGEAAIALTTKDKPEVRLYTRGKMNEKPGRITNCPKCKHEFIPTYSENDGYRELAVKLA